jgi:hypothetical protein
MSDNGVIRRSFGRKSEEATGGWRKFILTKFIICKYSLSYILRIIKSQKERWTGHVPCMGEKRNTYKILVKTCKKDATWKT